MGSRTDTTTHKQITPAVKITDKKIAARRGEKIRSSSAPKSPSATERCSDSAYWAWASPNA